MEYRIKHAQLERSLFELLSSVRIYNDKADSYPQNVGKFFKLRIFIGIFIHQVKKTWKFSESGPYLYNNYK